MFVGPVYWDSFFSYPCGGCRGGVVYIWIEWLRARERGGGGIGVVGRGERVMLVSSVDGLGPCVWWGEVM